MHIFRVNRNQGPAVSFLCTITSAVFLPQTAMQKIGYKDGLQEELLKKRYACYTVHVCKLVVIPYNYSIIIAYKSGQKINFG